MNTRLFLALGTAVWLITAHSALAEDTTGGTDAEASQTATTESTGDPAADAALPTLRNNPLGSNEWRRNDSSGRQNRPSDGRPGGESGASHGEGGEGGEGGGDGGGD